MSGKALPYATATTGARAKDEIERLLINLDCDDLVFAESRKLGAVVLQFSHRGRAVKMPANYKGWAALHLQRNPWTSRKHVRKDEYERRALEQGRKAVWSVIRDWLKGQLTAVECGIVPADHMFLPWMLTHDGKTIVAESPAVNNLLAAPTDDD